MSKMKRIQARRDESEDESESGASDNEVSYVSLSSQASEGVQTPSQATSDDESVHGGNPGKTSFN